MTLGRVGEKKMGLWGRLKRVMLTDVGALVRGLKAADLEQIEQMLIEADFGVPATMELVDALEQGVRSGKLKKEDDVRGALVDRLAAMLQGPEHPERIARATSGLTIILVVGVNGVGKTTTVAKLARRLKGEGRKVLLAAADTWRAGAVSQLQVWSQRIGVECVAGAASCAPSMATNGAKRASVELIGLLQGREGSDLRAACDGERFRGRGTGFHRAGRSRPVPNRDSLSGESVRCVVSLLGLPR